LPGAEFLAQIKEGGCQNNGKIVNYSTFRDGIFVIDKFLPTSYFFSLSVFG